MILAATVSSPSTLAKTEKVEANGITIACESFGPDGGEAILLIMGLGAQLTAWPNELCEELAQRGCRVIRFDNRDVGLFTHLDSLGSPDWEAIGAAMYEGRPAPLPYSLEDMAKDAIGLLDALDVEKAHVVGASMGGGIAQLIAIDHPERALSLTLIFSDTGNPDIPGPTDEVHTIPPALPIDSNIEDIIEREIIVWQTIGNSPSYPIDEKLLREQIRRDVERSYNPAGLERQAAAAMSAGDRREDLRKLHVPTVVIHGDADPIVPVENGRDTAETIPGAELRIIEDMAHDIPLALVEEFADAITAAASRASNGDFE